MHQRKISIIVTSAGTASAISVIKALKGQNEVLVNIIAVDLDPMAAGLFLADEFEIVPPATDKDYIPTLIRISERTGAKILIPIYSKEIKIISEQSSFLKQRGLHVMLSNPEAIEVCNNKSLMYNIALELGLNVPKFYESSKISEVLESELPLFAKPNSGSSSTGAERVDSLQRLNELHLSRKDLIFQQFINAQEVTVDVFCDENSDAKVIAPRLRLATKSGQSVKGKTIDNAIYINPVKLVCKRLGIRGVCNVQFFVLENELMFIEVNPRFAAGGLMLTVKAGANIPLILVKTILGLPIRNEEYDTKKNLVMTRYWEEIIFEHTKVEAE